MAETAAAFDLGVAGGGILGLSIAVEAARRGARVLVVDESRPAMAATPASAGVIWPLEALPPDNAFWPWINRGVAAYPGFIATLVEDATEQVEYVAHGLLRLDAEKNAMRPGEQWAQPGDIVNAPLLQGGWVADAARVSPARLQQVLIDEAGAIGVTLVEGTLENAPAGSRWSTTAGEFTCGRGVIATGAWSLPGLEVSSGLQPVRGQMLELTLRTPWPGPMLQDGDSYMVPVASDRVILGSTLESVGFDATPTAAGQTQILAEGQRIRELLGEHTVSAHWAGLRPCWRGGDAPLVGQLAAHPHLACALGLYRLGVTSAPAIAGVMANWALAGEPLPLVGA